MVEEIVLVRLNLLPGFAVLPLGKEGQFFRLQGMLKHLPPLRSVGMTLSNLVISTVWEISQCCY